MSSMQKVSGVVFMASSSKFASAIFSDDINFDLEAYDSSGVECSCRTGSVFLLLLLSLLSSNDFGGRPEDAVKNNVNKSSGP